MWQCKCLVVSTYDLDWEFLWSLQPSLFCISVMFIHVCLRDILYLCMCKIHSRCASCVLNTFHWWNVRDVSRKYLKSLFVACRDATRAFVSGNFTGIYILLPYICNFGNCEITCSKKNMNPCIALYSGDGLTDSVVGLSTMEVMHVDIRPNVFITVCFISCWHLILKFCVSTD